MTFTELLLSAKLGNTSAFEELFARYKNLLRKYSVVNGIFDEDLYQEQCVLFAHCIEIFYSKERVYRIWASNKHAAIACFDAFTGDCEWNICMIP